MSDTDGYQGWTNRETWAANLWLTNDEGLYESARETVQEADEDMSADALKDWWDELTDPDESLMECKTILQIVRDIGDEDRINWAEIAESLLAD